MNVFFYFGVKINSESKPKAKFELSSGEWIGPWNLILAQDNIPEGVNSTLVDRYVARYVQSQSIMPTFLQNRPPLESTLYTKPDDYAAFLGSSALKYMTQTQTNYSIANDTTSSKDPYAPYLQTCNNGNLQPILPLLELSFMDASDDDDSNNNNKTHPDDDGLEMALKLQYKMIAVPTPDEQAYRILPQLQSKFQGKGFFNILGGPYCYGDDPSRGYSFDLQLDSQNSGSRGVKFVRGCIPGYPCVPPAAMGGLPLMSNNHSCSNDQDHHHHQPDQHPGSGGDPNVVLTIVAYALAMFLCVSITMHFQIIGQHRKQQATANRRRDDALEEANIFRMLGGDKDEGDDGGDVNLDQSKPSYFGNDTTNLLEGIGIGAVKNDQREDVNPFGDLAPAEEAKVDPLQEPLLSSKA